MASEDLPTPDYGDWSDPRLSMPVILPYDDWRSRTSHGSTDETLPSPPPELLYNNYDDSVFPEPPPDYDTQDGSKYQGLIPPHKLHNPVLESKDRVQINKEIKFNAKRGASPLEKKSELDAALQRRKAAQKQREMATQQKKNRTSLEQRLEAQYEKVAENEKKHQDDAEKERKKSEFERIHEKIFKSSLQTGETAG